MGGRENANLEIEVFPMKTRRNGALEPDKEELGDKINNETNTSTHSKIPWRSPHRNITDSGVTHENVRQSGAKKGHNSSKDFLNDNRRISLPLRGKYASSQHREHNGLENGIRKPSSKRNGLPPSELSISSEPSQCTSCSQVGQEQEHEEVWKSKSDYFVAVLAYLLGIGNVIWFPQLCFKHGGGAFFIPYFIMLVLEGIPLVCLEMAIGQRLGKRSLVMAWKDLSPSLSGIGVAAVMQSLVTLFYYNFIVAWFLYYFVHSLRRTLLWETCPTSDNNGSKTLNAECEKSSPAEYYWYRETLDVADDINESTGINMYLYVFVVVSWTMSFALSMRGMRRTSKILLLVLVLIVTILVTFFFVGVHLEGWAEGLARLFVPEWKILQDPVVWMDAASQIFFSLGVGFGTLVILSSGNKAKNSCYEDAWMCALANCVTSVCASIIMFSFFGFKAHYKIKKCNEDIAKLNNAVNGSLSSVNINMSCNKRKIFDELPPGLSLGFAGMSETFTHMSLSPLWSALFYFLLFLLGSSSMLGMLEVLITTFKEIGCLPRRWRNEVLCGGVCLVFCISNLIFVQSTGFYLLEVISGANSIPLLITGLAECVGVAYIYGMDKFSNDLEQMTGKPVKKHWKICWKFISPLIILGVIIGGIVQRIKAIANEKFSYTAWDRNQGKIKDQPYPAWGYVIYLAFLLIPCACIIYPSLKNILTRRHRSDSEEGSARSRSTCSIVCEPCRSCYGRTSRTYDISSSATEHPCANGHVNPTAEED